MTMHASIFDSEPAADDAVTRLLAAGFQQRHIHVVSKRPFGKRLRHIAVHTLSPSGAHTRRALLIGAPIGAALGAAAAALVLLIRGGPELLTLSAVVYAAAAGAVCAAFISAMSTRGYEPAIADFHDQALGRDQYLVAVDLEPGDPLVAEAEKLLARNGKRAVRLPED